MLTMAKRKTKPPNRRNSRAAMTAEEAKRIRTSLGLTQRQAAVRIGVSWRTWQDYERGVITVTKPISLLIRQLEAGHL